jgi:hypothetical protein
MEKLYDVVVDFTWQRSVHSDCDLRFVSNRSPLKRSRMYQLEEDMGFSDNGNDDQIFNVTSKEHAIQHKISLQWVGAHNKEHDELWDVILKLMNHIDKLESNRDGF